MAISDNMVELQRRIALYDDEPAYREIFFTFYKALVRFALTFLEDKQSAEEVVSDVLMKVWQNRKTLTSIEKCLSLRQYAQYFHQLSF